MIFNVIFFVVLSSVLVQGTTISPLARCLKVDEPVGNEPSYSIEMTLTQGWRGKLQEVIIQENSPVIGKAIYEMKLPHDYLIVLIATGDEFLIPNGSIILRANDRMLGLAQPDTHERVIKMIELLTNSNCMRES